MTECQHTEQTCTGCVHDYDCFYSTWTCDACGHWSMTTTMKAPEVSAWEQGGGAA